MNTVFSSFLIGSTFGLAVALGPAQAMPARPSTFELESGVTLAQYGPHDAPAILSKSPASITTIDATITMIGVRIIISGGNTITIGATTTTIVHTPGTIILTATEPRFELTVGVATGLDQRNSVSSDNPELGSAAFLMQGSDGLASLLWRAVL